MAEDTKENKASQEEPAQPKKETAVLTPPPASPAVATPPPPRPAPVAPRPPAHVQAPPSQAPRGTGRRTFLKLLVGISAVLSIIPFVPWGNFLLSSVSSTGPAKRQQVVLDLNTTTNNNANGNVAGKVVNVNDLSSFPPNSKWLVTYPTSGDITIDSQSPDTFTKFQLIRLPTQLGGSEKSAAAFVAFSKVCVHLWCSPNYDPQKSSTPSFETYQCPCHGSIYEVPDGLAIAGPASEQAFPTNAIPMLTLTTDSNGDLYIEPPVWDVEHNGVLGYGRDYASYKNFILPEAEGKGT
jgi:rieske iron-sulfur protein